MSRLRLVLALASTAACAACAAPVAPAAPAAPQPAASRSADLVAASSYTVVADLPAGVDPSAVVALWKRRFDGLHARFEIAGQTVTATVPPSPDWDLASIRALLTRPGHLEIRPDASDLPQMLAIVGAMPGEGDRRYDRSTEVGGTIAEVPTRDGRTSRQGFLLGPDEASIRATVDAIRARVPAAALPPTHALTFEPLANHYGARPTLVAFAVAAPVVTGADLAAAILRDGHDGGREVVVELTDDGGERFGAFTKAHVGDRIVIIVDDRALSKPSIYSPILHHKLVLIPAGQSGASDRNAELMRRIILAPLPAGVAIGLR